MKETDRIVICDTAEEGGIRPANYVVPLQICINQSRKVERTVLKWVITKVRNPENRCSQTLTTHLIYIFGLLSHQVSFISGVAKRIFINVTSERYASLPK